MELSPRFNQQQWWVHQKKKSQVWADMQEWRKAIAKQSVQKAWKAQAATLREKRQQAKQVQACSMLAM